MTDQKQQPVTLTERQAFEWILRTLKKASFQGEDVIPAAECMIFCERVVSASDPGVLSPTPSEPDLTQDPVPTQIKKKAGKK